MKAWTSNAVSGSSVSTKYKPSSTDKVVCLHKKQAKPSMIRSNIIHPAVTHGINKIASQGRAEHNNTTTAKQRLIMTPGPGFSRTFKSSSSNNLKKEAEECSNAVKKPVNDSKLPPDVLEFAQECLKCHNVARSKHGVPPLVLSHKVIN